MVCPTWCDYVRRVFFRLWLFRYSVVRVSAAVFVKLLATG